MTCSTWLQSAGAQRLWIDEGCSECSQVAMRRSKRGFWWRDQLVAFLSFHCSALSHLLRGPFHRFLLFCREDAGSVLEGTRSSGILVYLSLIPMKEDKHMNAPLWSEHKAGRWQLYNQRLALARSWFVPQCVWGAVDDVVVLEDRRAEYTRSENGNFSSLIVS